MSGPDRSQYENLPIPPSYDEAIAAHPPSSRSRTGPEEVSDDAERQGLLGQQSGYQRPTVESARDSLDSLDGLDTPTSPSQRRREMEQMDIEDPLNDSGPSNSLLRQRFAKNFWTSSFSSLTLPSFGSWRSWIPSFSFPRINYESIDSHRGIIIGRLFGIFIIAGMVWVLLATNIIGFGSGRLGVGQMYDPESIRVFVQKHVNNRDMMQEYLGHITEFPHLAGTEGSYVLGEWIQEIFKTAELENVDMERFDVYMNYPRRNGRRLSMDNWEAVLEEEGEQTAVFHGHSRSGEVKGPIVYANYGSRDDFNRLRDEGIDVKGAVVLMRYYGTQEDAGLKVKAAEMAGAVGAILYSDPVDVGYVKGPTFPQGRFLPDDGVQRDSVGLQSWIMGDMLSPGWASTPGEKNRLEVSNSTGLNTIPSLPISWNDARYLLNKNHGLGKQLGGWQGDRDMEYWTGDSKSSAVINLKNDQDEETRQGVYNVIGKITGWEQPEKKIVVGSRRDAWCLGAGESGTGTAIMLDVIRIFGELRRHGWRPLRTIEFASWDSAAFNLEGSTEHVENRIDELRRDGIAYINIDAAVTGPDFTVHGSPLLKRPILEASNRVRQPTDNDDEHPKSVKEYWERSGARMLTPTGKKDTLPFQSIAGMSSIDIAFSGDRYSLGSCYDRYEWIASQDNGFRTHQALGEIFVLVVLELSDKPLLPFDLHTMADGIDYLVDHLKTYAMNHDGVRDLDFKPLEDAAQLVHTAAKRGQEFEEMWSRHVFNHGGFEGARHSGLRIEHNDRVAQFEKVLLDLSEGGGLKDRNQYKNLLYAPQKWDSTKGIGFPAVVDAIDANDQREAQFQIQVVADKLRDAALSLPPPTEQEQGDTG